MHLAVLKLCKEAMKQIKKDDTWDWLYVLPLCHILSGTCTLYDNIEYYPQKHHFFDRVDEYGYQELQHKLSLGYVQWLFLDNIISDPFAGLLIAFIPNWSHVLMLILYFFMTSFTSPLRMIIEACLEEFQLSSL